METIELVVGTGGFLATGAGETAVAGANGRAIVGDGGTAVAGDGGYAKAGAYGRAVSGECGLAIAGAYGNAAAGDGGTAVCGSYGVAVALGSGGSTAIAGPYGTAIITETGGDSAAAVDQYGTIRVFYTDAEGRRQVAVGKALPGVIKGGDIAEDEDGKEVVALAPNEFYRVNNKGQFIALPDWRPARKA